MTTRDLDKLTLRELQLLSARVMATIEATNNNLWKFDQSAPYDSQNWYRATIKWYIEQYGGWPDQVGPGAEIKLIHV